MAHLFKMTEWQGSSGRWYCNDTTDLAGPSAKWWTPARMLNTSLTDYIIMLKDKFNATIVKYCPETDVLIFYWDKQIDIHKFILYINKESKKKNFMV